MSVWPHLCPPSRHHLCADRFPVPWTGYLLPLFVAPFLSPRHRKNSLGIRPSILQPGPPSRALTPLHWRQPLRFPNREPFSCGKVPPGSPLLTRLRPQPPRPLRGPRPWPPRPLRRLRPSCRRCPHAGRSRHQRPSTYRRCRAAASFSRGSPAATVPPQPRLPGVCSLHSRLSWAFHHHLQALRLMAPRTENQWVPPFSATVRIPSGASSTTLTCWIIPGFPRAPIPRTRGPGTSEGCTQPLCKSVPHQPRSRPQSTDQKTSVPGWQSATRTRERCCRCLTHWRKPDGETHRRSSAGCLSPSLRSTLQGQGPLPSPHLERDIS